jgi:hypothetical protein
LTFEQWWAGEKWNGIDIATPQEAYILRRISAGCWNAALDAGALEAQPISEKIKLEELRVKL